MKDFNVQFWNGNLDTAKMEVIAKFETKYMETLEIIRKQDDALIRLSTVFLLLRL